MLRFTKIFFSYWVTIFLLAILAIGAGIATFIENDFGSSTAKIIVYNSFWYQLVLTLTIINLIGIMVKTKMIRSRAKFIFHSSFIFILFGAALTRFYGYEGIMHIKEGQTTNQMISLEPYIQVSVNDNGKESKYYFEKSLAAFGNKPFSYEIPLESKTLFINYVDYKLAKKNGSEMGLLRLEAKIGDESNTTRVVGNKAIRTGVVKTLSFKDNIKVSLEYGAKPMELPFFIKLVDFELKRYPGSMAPSSYSSKVLVLDKQNKKEFDYHIYMNHILNYGGFKFFQSSYDADEKGTILSVNHDIGHWPTYFGYFLLALGLIMNFFDKKSRFSKLTEYISKANKNMVFAFVLLIGLQNNMDADEQINATMKYLENYKKTSQGIAKQFSYLVVQSNFGRMEPIDTLSKKILNKLTKKDEFLGMNANQVVLGMLTRPDIWKDIKILKIRTPKLKKYLGISKSRNFVAFSEIFNENEYKLQELLEDANKIDPNARGTFERDVIKLDERLNIVYMVFFSEIFKIYPKLNEPNNTWYSPLEAMKSFTGKDQELVKYATSSFVNAMVDSNFTKASKALTFISDYQNQMGKGVIPSKEMISLEIIFNKLEIFPRLTLSYLVMGILLFIIAFATVFNQQLYSKELNLFLFSIIALLFFIQTFGMGFRWYISGHAPWSDTYESLVYIAWSTMFAGVVFFRKSLLALSATVIMAAVFMFTAHLSGVDPQITNLVPVLKSYWLTIHVSIITGSYGFLALGCMLGFMALVLFIFRDDNKPHIDSTIKHITAINETSLIIGLSALVVGNFLGGVWANESWGRYWGWDPKETWAYVAIIVYVIVLHLRLIPKLNSPYVFAVTSTLAFSSILMTYFGVNFYLSGMHSYATGDPVPIPTWVYVLTMIVFLVIVLAGRKRNLKSIKV